MTAAATLDTLHADSVAALAAFNAFGPNSLYWLALGNSVAAVGTKLDALHVDAAAAHADRLAIIAKLEALHADAVTIVTRLEAAGAKLDQNRGAIAALSKWSDSHPTPNG